MSLKTDSPRQRITAQYFLELYVISANAAIVVFVVGAYVIFSSYHTFNFYLNKWSSSYRRIPEARKFYVLSNLIKSAVLLSYSPLAAKCLYDTLVLDVWDSNRIRIMGTLCEFRTYELSERESETHRY